jgi:hypothetical protein
MNVSFRFAAILSLVVPVPLALLAQPAVAAPTHQSFQQFFSAFRAAVLADDRDKVVGMVAFPFRDFAGAEVDRSSTMRAEFLASYDQIFTPAVIAAIRANRIRAFVPGVDDGEAPGPLGQGEYLLDAPDNDDQLVFSPDKATFRLTRIPFYS